MGVWVCIMRVAKAESKMLSLVPRSTGCSALFTVNGVTKFVGNVIDEWWPWRELRMLSMTNGSRSHNIFEAILEESFFIILALQDETRLNIRLVMQWDEDGKRWRWYKDPPFCSLVLLERSERHGTRAILEHRLNICTIRIQHAFLGTQVSKGIKSLRSKSESPMEELLQSPFVEIFVEILCGTRCPGHVCYHFYLNLPICPPVSL